MPCARISAREFDDVYEPLQVTAQTIYQTYQRMVDFNGPFEDLPERETESIDIKILLQDKFCLCGVWFYPLSNMWVPCVYMFNVVGIHNLKPRGGTHLECHEFDFQYHAQRFIEQSTAMDSVFNYLSTTPDHQTLSVKDVASGSYNMAFSTPIIKQ